MYEDRRTYRAQPRYRLAREWKAKKEKLNMEQGMAEYTALVLEDNEWAIKFSVEDNPVVPAVCTVQKLLKELKVFLCVCVGHSAPARWLRTKKCMPKDSPHRLYFRVFPS